MARLSAEQLEFFEREGYLVVEDVLEEATLQALHAEYSAILDREVKRLLAEGKISEGFEGLGFLERYKKVLPQLEKMYDLYQHLDIQLPLLRRMEPDATMNMGPAIFDLLRHPSVLDMAESILGPEIDCNPIKHTRIKPPKSALKKDVDSNVAKAYWHQDEAVLSDDAKDIKVLTVWLAITDSTEENGCLICQPRSHKRREVTMHCPGSTFSSAEIFIPDEICDAEMLPLPVKRGGAVLLHQRTVHGSFENVTESIRWSFDLRYNVRGQHSGREVFPKFLARSLSTPEEELRDHEAYAKMWLAARDDLAALGEVAFNERWARFYNHPLCA